MSSEIAVRRNNFWQKLRRSNPCAASDRAALSQDLVHPRLHQLCAVRLHHSHVFADGRSRRAADRPSRSVAIFYFLLLYLNQATGGHRK